RRRHTRFSRDWSSDVCSSDLNQVPTCSPIAKTVDKITAYTWDIIADSGAVDPNGDSMSISLDGANVYTKADVSIVSSSSVKFTRSEERRVGKECITWM